MSGRDMYGQYPYDFSHYDVPRDKSKLISLMCSLETGRWVTFAPSIPLSDVMWLDKYYREMSHGRIYMERKYLGRQVSARLHGLPPSMTAEVRFDAGVKSFKDRWWYYVALVLIAVLTPLIFIFGLFI